MKGTIYTINQSRGMVAVETEGADFSVFEIISSNEVEIGDAVEWDDDTSLGTTILKNLTSGEVFEVYFQNHWVGLAVLNQQLLIK